MLELVNAARANPLGEAARLGIDLNQGLTPGAIATNAKPPLAFHSRLITAARGHSDWMLLSGIFSHTGVDGTSPTQRAQRAGYEFPAAENIAYRWTNGVPDYNFMTTSMHEALVRSPGHRKNIMAEDYVVVGLGLRPGTFVGPNAFVATQKFSSGGATLDSGPFILGVCYTDRNNNGAYDLGEGAAQTAEARSHTVSFWEHIGCKKRHGIYHLDPVDLSVYLLVTLRLRGLYRANNTALAAAFHLDPHHIEIIYRNTKNRLTGQPLADTED
jgi:hypothetical protein